MEKDAREGWLKRRVEEVIRRARDLDYLIARNGLPELYGRHSFPEAERFAEIEVVDGEANAVAFLNAMNRCFVEPIDAFGTKNGEKDHFWTVLPSKYPDLYEALLRIRVYRNHKFHRELRPKVEEEFLRFKKIDFDNQGPWGTADGYFLLQQIVLDELLVGLHCETSRYS